MATDRRRPGVDPKARAAADRINNGGGTLWGDRRNVFYAGYAAAKAEAKGLTEDERLRLRRMATENTYLKHELLRKRLELEELRARVSELSKIGFELLDLQTTYEVPAKPLDTDDDFA